MRKRQQEGGAGGGGGGGRGAYMPVTNVQQEAMPAAGLEAGLQPAPELQRYVGGHDLGGHPWRAAPVQCAHPAAGSLPC